SRYRLLFSGKSSGPSGTDIRIYPRGIGFRLASATFRSYLPPRRASSSTFGGAIGPPSLFERASQLSKVPANCQRALESEASRRRGPSPGYVPRSRATGTAENVCVPSGASTLERLATRPWQAPEGAREALRDHLPSDAGRCTTEPIGGAPPSGSDPA